MSAAASRVVINKLDRENADYKNAFHSIQDVLGKKCAPFNCL